MKPYEMDDREMLREYSRKRSPELREALILRYAPLIHFVLGRLGISRTSGPDYDDACSEGMIGLMEAVDGYDPAFGTQFSTYATLRIRGRVLDHLRAQDWLSRGARKRTRQIQQGLSDLWGKLGRAPSDEELARHLEMDLPALQQALVDASLVIVSMDGLTGESEGDASLHDLLEDESQPDPAEQVEEVELMNHLTAAIKSLPERDQLVLSLYYYNELTLREVGEVLNISESRVCQIHARAIMSLKAALSQDAAGRPGTVPTSNRKRYERHSNGPVNRHLSPDPTGA